MKLNPKYIKIRLAMLFIAPFILFLIVILFFFVLPDYLVQKENLSTKQGVISEINEYEYFDDNLIKDKAYEVIDIGLKNESSIIRLSDGFDKKYWKQIKEPKNIGRTIKVLFLPRLQHGNIIQNPQELIIDGFSIINFERSRKILGWFLAGLIISIIVLIIFEIIVIRSYKSNHFEQDKKEGKYLAWTIIKKAFAVE